MCKLVKIDNLKEISALLLSKLGETRIICLTGTLGAGKTTLAKDIGKQLGIKENITSPTFTIIKEYEYSDGMFVHIDAYRTNNDDESMMAISDYDVGRNIIVVEWWEKIEEIIDFTNAIKVDIDIVDEETRRYTIHE